MRLLLLAVAFVAASPALAEECWRALISDKVEFTGVIETDLSVLKIIDEETYQKNEDSFSADALFAVYGVPVDASGSYQALDEYRKKVNSEYRYEYSHDESVSYASQTLGKNSKEAYIAYLEANSRTNPGFYAWISYVDPEVALVTLYWNPTGPNPEKPNISVPFISGGQAESPIPDVIPRSEKVSFAFTREDNKSLKVFVQGAGFGPYNLVVATKPNIVLPCHLQHDNDTVTLLRHEGAIHRQVCNACSDCQERSYNTFSEQTYDVACIKSIEHTNTAFIRGFDCSWTPWGPNKQNMLYGNANQRIELGGADCQQIADIATSLGIAKDATFCR